MALLGDRVQETTTSTGTGSITLNGAVTGYVTFNSTFSNGDVVWYVIDDGAGNWEIGYGTVGTGTLTRTVFQSSNSNNLVSFGVGTKRIFCTAPYTYLLPDQTGNSGKILTTNGTTSSWTSIGSAGGVTAVSVATANGLAGTSSGGSTPALTLSTTVTGMLKGDGTAISAAVAGTDYAGLASANTFTNNQVISVNSSSDALRITQTGAGNALLVEDSANPDATPFVVDASGKVIVGTNTSVSGTFSSAAYIQQMDNSGSPNYSAGRFTNDSGSAVLDLLKSRSTTIGGQTVVQSGDALGNIYFSGSDGSSFIRGALIRAEVDGTPGTNDMPGRLVFSTTADGASSPTERMRIDNAGRVVVGGSSATVGQSFRVRSNITGAVNSAGIVSQASIQSDVTSAGLMFSSFPSTADVTFTLASLIHYDADQGTITGGSRIAPTAQYGFRAASTLIGATNNFGFYSNIASGTGRYNFYANGSADNYFAGAVGIGTTSLTGYNMHLSQNATGATTTYGFRNSPTAQSDVTSQLNVFYSRPYTAAAAFTLANVYGFRATGISVGSGSAVTNQFGFVVDSDLTGATYNYGFYSNIASGTGRYNFYAAGTADNYFAGAVGIGTTSLTGYTLRVGKTLTGATNTYGVLSNGSVQSDVTNAATMFRSIINTQATAFTLGTFYHYTAEGGTIGAGSSVTSQYGYLADPGLTGATNNYGFYSNIASGTGRYNFYAAGTADNYFAGRVGLGGSSSIATLYVSTNLTGGTTAYGVLSDSSVLSDVTTQGIYYRTNVSTAAAAFTTGAIFHYQAAQGTFGAGSTVTTQYGFAANASLTGATNNFGFYSNIASGTGRYNFYAAGTADNYFAGAVGIGGSPGAGQTLLLNKSLTGATTAYGAWLSTTALSDVTSNAIGFRSTISTSAAAFTLSYLRNFYASQGNIGAGSAITTQYGFQAESDLTGATNNYGFYSNIASGTGRYNFYAAGTADNYFAGAVGIGSIDLARFGIHNSKTITAGGTSTTAYGQMNDGVVQSDVTVNAFIYRSGTSTQAAAFTLGGLYHFDATFNGVGAGSTVTNQYGFNASSTLTGATNNYGFYSNIASGTGRYNFYANGTADNYFQGAVIAQVNAFVERGLAIPAGGLQARGLNFSSTANFGVFFGSGAPTLSAAKGSLYLRSDGSTTNNRMYVNTDGGTTWTAVTTAA